MDDGWGMPVKFSARRGNAKRITVSNVPGAEAWRKGKHCLWCGRAVRYGALRDPLQATREHYVPRSEGGSTSSKNIAVACAQCNNTRGSNMDWVPFEMLRMTGQKVTQFQWLHLQRVEVVPPWLMERARVGKLVIV